ncbi:MAG: hypothetical protein U0132_13745 [Gemmatimonadaceae bacterium]
MHLHSSISGPASTPDSTEGRTPVDPSGVTGTFTIPLESRRRDRALLIQKLQHVLPSVFLLADGLERLGGEHSTGLVALAVTEVAVSVLVIGAFIRALRRLRHSSNEPAGEHASHGVDWVDLFLGGMLITEALVHREETGHLPRPTVLLAVTVFVMGLLHGRVSAWATKRRALRVTEDGISIARRLRPRLDASWEAIDRIDLAATEARIVTRTRGERRIDLTDLKNAAAVVEVLTIARERLRRYNLGAGTPERLAP